LLLKLKYGRKPQFSMGRVASKRAPAIRPVKSAIVSSSINASANNTKKKRGFAGRVRSQPVHDVHDLRPQMLHDLCDDIAKLSLIDVSGGDGHDSILWPTSWSRQTASSQVGAAS
jgi:hypothetical protein